MATLKVTNIKNESFAGDQLYLKSDGRIGIGTTSPDSNLDIEGSGSPELRVTDTTNTVGAYIQSNDTKAIFGSRTNHPVQLEQNAGAALFIDTLKNVGIGTISPDTKLEINGGADAIAKVTGTTTAARLDLKTNSHHRFIQTLESDGALRVYDQTNASERVRIDSSGRMIIGHSSSMSEGCSLQVARANDNTVEFFGFSANSNGARINLTKSRNATIGANTIVDDDDTIGELHFRAANGTAYFRVAAIEAEMDGSISASSLPGRLIFSTTASGATTQTERMRIKSDGDIEVGGNLKTNNLSGRNFIINGAMNIAQRGTAANAAQDIQTVDRFGIAQNVVSGAMTQSQVSATVNGFRKAYRIDITTAKASLAANDYAPIYYTIEAKDAVAFGNGTTGAKKITLSFWVKSNKTGTYCFSLRSHDPGRLITATYAISSADTWEKKELNIAADPAGGQINDDNGHGFILYWMLCAGSTFTGVNTTTWQTYNNGGFAYQQGVNLFDSTSNYFELTGVQFEIGSIATEFEHRSYGEELALCKRYYEYIEPTDGWAMWSWQTDEGGSIMFFDEKRATPTASIVGSIANGVSPGSGSIGAYGVGGWRSLTSLSVSTTRKNSTRIFCGGMNLANAGDSFGLYFKTNTGIKLEAEL